MEPVTIRSYHTLFQSAREVPLYANPWWLEATCGVGGWDALIRYDSAQKPVGGIPFQRSRIRGLTAITTPPMTQWVSLLSGENDSKEENSFTLSDLPKASILDLSLKPDVRINLQEYPTAPALKYSFIIPRADDMKDVRAKYNEGLRRNLKQAGQLHSVEESDNLAGFQKLCHQTYHDRDMQPPAWFDRIVPLVYKKLIANQCGTLTLATAQGKIIAGILTAWDRYTTYYLAGGKTADDHGTAAHALLLDNAIQSACARGTSFDFEGSMHPGIANFFQSFGSVPVSYWNFKKYRGAGRIWAALKR
ncbi:MAG TPA: GNAT family N-acetyltransferase [Saprospiraceae bacterium]|jgi:GNAT acetyltransferase-like protein